MKKGLQNRWGIGIVFFIMAVAVFVLGYMRVNKQLDFHMAVNSEDYNLELDDVEININGLEREYSFLYLTDNQADFGGQEDLGWFGNADQRRFHDEKGVSSADNFQNWIRYANDSQVDAFLTGGDVIDFYSDENINAIQEQFAKLEMPYLYTYGNHDSYVPWKNSFEDENENFLEMFQESDCEFQLLDEEEFCIVSIRNYQIDGTAQVSKKALERFKAVSEKGKPIILICHVPLYTSYTKGLQEMTTSIFGNVFVRYDAGDFGTVDEALLLGDNCGYELTAETQEFLNMITDDNSPVVAVLAGHLHSSWQGYLNEDIMEYVGAAAFENKGALIHVSGK